MKKIVHLIAWILHFIHNSSNPKEKRHGKLMPSEFQEAERRMLCMTQREFFSLQGDA